MSQIIGGYDRNVYIYVTTYVATHCSGRFRSKEVIAPSLQSQLKNTK